MNLDQAREQLIMSARALKADNDIDGVRHLCDAASVYAKERIKASPRPRMKEATTLTLPFGREKGVRLNEAKTNNLQWVASAIKETLDDPAKEKWRAQNVTLLEAIERELESR